MVALKVVQIKLPSSVVVAELPSGEALVGGWATVTAAAPGREALWSMQVYYTYRHTVGLLVVFVHF